MFELFLPRSDGFFCRGPDPLADRANSVSTVTGRVTPKGGPADSSDKGYVAQRPSLRQRNPMAYFVAVFVIAALIIGPLAVGIAAIFS